MPAMPAEVLQEIGYSVNDDVMNRRDPTTIDRQELVWLSILEKRKKVSGQAGGKTIVKLKKNGGLDIQFWERRDRLGFAESHIDLELEYPFVNIHMGLELVHDDLADQGYDITPNGPRSRTSFKKMSEDEANTLVDIVEEKIEDMHDSWDVNLELALLRDGSSDTKAIVGLDGLVTTTPTTGTIGGKSRANPKLQHNVYTDLSSATLAAGGNMRQRMTDGVRKANNNSRGRMNKGKMDVIIAGDNFVDGYMTYGEKNNFTVNTKASGTPKLDIGISETGLVFSGGGYDIPIVRCPAFKRLQEIESASVDWNDRAYGLTSKAWHLCHPKGKDKVFSAPLDQSDVRYTRFSIDGRYALVETVPDSSVLWALA